MGTPIVSGPLLQLAIAAFQQAEFERKALQDPSICKERRALPSAVARAMLKEALTRSAE